MARRRTLTGTLYQAARISATGRAVRTAHPGRRARTEPPRHALTGETPPPSAAEPVGGALVTNVGSWVPSADRARPGRVQRVALT